MTNQVKGIDKLLTVLRNEKSKLEELKTEALESNKELKNSVFSYRRYHKLIQCQVRIDAFDMILRDLEHGGEIENVNFLNRFVQTAIADKISFKMKDAESDVININQIQAALKVAHVIWFVLKNDFNEFSKYDFIFNMTSI